MLCLVALGCSDGNTGGSATTQGATAEPAATSPQATAPTGTDAPLPAVDIAPMQADPTQPGAATTGPVDPSVAPATPGVTATPVPPTSATATTPPVPTTDPGVVTEPATPTPIPTGTPSVPFAGFGRDTPGGLGGAVIKVTTLAPTGPGSLSAALGTPGPRVVVFEVGGVIDLNLVRLDVRQPFLTIAGQTAPSPGITLIRGGMRIFTNDVVVQHIRFRMGDAGQAVASGFEPDVATEGPGAFNVVFDHVSAAWGVDENLSVSGPRFDGLQGTSRRVTISNSIIAEGLRDSIHEGGLHSDGTLVHDYCNEVAIVGNLYAHNDERNPWFKGFANGVIVNNVIYNPGRWAIRLGPVDSEWAATDILVPEGPQVSVMGNYMRYGIDTPAGQTMVGSNSRGSAFLADNLAFDLAGLAVPVAAPIIGVLNAPPVWPTGLVALPAASVVDSVLAQAGARPADRDAVDLRVIADFVAGTGSFIDSQDEVGGYPIATPTTRVLDVPTADIAAWLAQFSIEVEVGAP